MMLITREILNSGPEIYTNSSKAAISGKKVVIMAINFFDKFKGDEDYVELEPAAEQEEEKKILVQVERIGNVADSDRIQRKLREGYIMLVKIKDLRDKDLEELKRAVERIKRTAVAMNGDIAVIGDEWLLVCPSSAKVHREAAAE